VTTECIHFWIVDPPEGPYSQGSCQKCGLSKPFANSEADWTNQRGYRPPTNIGKARYDPEGGRRRA